MIGHSLNIWAVVSNVITVLEWHRCVSGVAVRVALICVRLPILLVAVSMLGVDRFMLMALMDVCDSAGAGDAHGYYGMF